MAINYKTRRKCGEENENSQAGDPGHGLGWHYIFEDQTVIDESAVCPDHPTAHVEHFVILLVQEI